MMVTIKLIDPIDFHRMEKRNTMEVNGVQQLFAYSWIIKQTKEIHRGLSKLWVIKLNFL